MLNSNELMCDDMGNKGLYPVSIYAISYRSRCVFVCVG